MVGSSGTYGDGVALARPGGCAGRRRHTAFGGPSGGKSRGSRTWGELRLARISDRGAIGGAVSDSGCHGTRRLRTGVAVHGELRTPSRGGVRFHLSGVERC